MKKKLEEMCVKELEVISQNRNTEVRHAEADGVLCNLLLELGYKKVVEKYQEMQQYFWYA